ncbi:MAG: 2-hydroxyacyl-CoA dehydratase [Candidatus Xenobiia bacterium LiM19]
MKREKKISYCCPFVPAEWIAAHGLEPQRLIPGNKERNHSAVSAGICTYAGAIVEEAGSDDDSEGFVLTTLCDQMRRAADLLTGRINTPLFLMHVPAVSSSEGVRRLYREELERLGRFLERCGGSRPGSSEIIHIMGAYDARRAELREAGKHMSGLQRIKAGMEFQKTGKLTVPDSSTEQKNHGIPLALLGGPVMELHLNIIDFIERSGGAIMLDGTDTGERCFPAPFDRIRIAEDPLDELTRAYFDSIPHPFRRPNDLFYQWLGREVKARSVKGLLILRYPWCDIWHGEVARLKEWSDIPVLDLDVSESRSGQDNRIMTRIMAFLEMLT